MLINILVPVDFSPTSQIAVGYAISVARRFRGRLILLNVIEPVTGGMSGFPPIATRIEEEGHAQALRMLPRLVAPEDQDDLDLKVLVRRGSVEDQILSVVEEEEPCLVVMGTHGRGFIARLLAGSVTQHILRKVGAPVIIVGGVTEPFKMSRILFATDLTEASDKCFDWVLNLAKGGQSELLILHVLSPRCLTYEGAEFDVDWFERTREQARESLAAMARRAAAAQVSVETAMEYGSPADAILKNSSAVDLIALGIETKGVIERLMLGTTAERVVREANVPVLCIPVEVAPAMTALPVAGCVQPA